MLELWDGNRKNDKQSIIHMDLHKTKQQVGQCIIGALLVLKIATGKLKFISLIMAWTWGKPPPSPLYYILCVATRPTPKWHFVLKLLSGNPEIPKVGTPTILGADNFIYKPLIEMWFKAKLQPLSKSFQWYIVCYLHASKTKRFMTFSGWESNCQF